MSQSDLHSGSTIRASCLGEVQETSKGSPESIVPVQVMVDTDQN